MLPLYKQTQNLTPQRLGLGESESITAGEAFDFSEKYSRMLGAQESIFESDELRMKQKYGESQILQPDDANKKYGIEGRLQFNEPVRESVAQAKRERKEQEMFYQHMLGKSRGFAAGAASFAGSFVGNIDAVTIAASFLPMGMLSNAGKLGSAISKMGKYKRLAVSGAIEGAVGNAVIEPFILKGQEYLGGDYGLSDSLMNIGFGAVLGAGLHMGTGPFRKLPPAVTDNAIDASAAIPAGRSIGQMSESIINSTAISAAERERLLSVSTETYQAIMTRAVSDIEAGRPVEISALIQRDSQRPLFDISRPADAGSRNAPEIWLKTVKRVFPDQSFIMRPSRIRGNELASFSSSRGAIKFIQSAAKEQGFPQQMFHVKQKGDQWVVFEPAPVEFARNSDGSVRVEPKAKSLNKDGFVTLKLKDEAGSNFYVGVRGQVDSVDRKFIEKNSDDVFAYDPERTIKGLSPDDVINQKPKPDINFREEASPATSIPEALPRFSRNDDLLAPVKDSELDQQIDSVAESYSDSKAVMSYVTEAKNIDQLINNMDNVAPHVRRAFDCVRGLQ